MWTVVDMLGYCSHGLCAFTNMVSNANIARKSGEKEGKIDTMQTVVDSAGVLFTWPVHISQFCN